MGSGSGGIRPLAAPAAYVRGRLEALHRLAEALAELGELARSEEDRGDAADDHQLGEPEAEEAHRGHAPAPRTAAPRAAGGARGRDPGAELRGLRAEKRRSGAGQAGHRRGFRARGRGGGRAAPGGGAPGEAGARERPRADRRGRHRREETRPRGIRRTTGGRREARPRGANCACVRGDDLERAGGCAARRAERGGAQRRGTNPLDDGEKPALSHQDDDDRVSAVGDWTREDWLSNNAPGASVHR